MGPNALHIEWMIDDIEKGISVGANYLAALGLVAYTEIVGREMLRAEKGTEYPSNQPSFYHFAEKMDYPVDALKTQKA